jgi:hypothetical protein
MSFMIELIMEFLYVTCNPAFATSNNSIPNVAELSLLVEHLLEWSKHEKNSRVQIRLLQILQRIAEIDIGVLLMLSKDGNRQIVRDMIAWIPELLQSPDLTVQDLNIALHTVLLIQKIIDHAPRNSENADGLSASDLGHVRVLHLLLEPQEDLGALVNLYENCQNIVLELPFRGGVDMIHVEPCELVAGVVGRFKDVLLDYVNQIKDNEKKLDTSEITKHYEDLLGRAVEGLPISQAGMLSSGADGAAIGKFLGDTGRLINSNFLFFRELLGLDILRRH